MHRSSTDNKQRRQVVIIQWSVSPSHRQRKPSAEHGLVSGLSARRVAAELGINVRNLPNWNRKFKEPPAGQRDIPCKYREFCCFIRI